MVACVALTVCSAAVVTVKPVSAIEQAPTMLWSKTLAPASYMPVDVKPASDGGYIVAGRGYDSSADSSHVYLAKFDASGHVVWERTYGSAQQQWGFTVVEAPDNGYVAAGFVERSDPAANYPWEAYFLKVDPNGNTVWEKTYNYTYRNVINSIAVVPDGYLASGFISTVPNAGAEAYFIKLDFDGDKAWEKAVANPDNVWTNAGQLTSDGGYISAGETFPRGADSWSYEAYDGYLLKVDANGNPVWDQSYSATPDHYDSIATVQQTSDNGYIAAGGTGYYYSQHIWIFKTDSQGSKIWERSLSLGQRSQINSIRQTPDGGYIAACGVQQASGRWQGYLLRLDSNGYVIWDQTYSAPSASLRDNTAQLTVSSASDTLFVFGNIADVSRGADFDWYVAEFGTATDQDQNASTLTVAASPPLVSIGQQFTISGTLATLFGVPVTNAPVYLQTYQPGTLGENSTENGTWTNAAVAPTHTNDTGEYGFSLNETTADSYRYRVAYDGNALISGTTSPAVTVTVTPNVGTNETTSSDVIPPSTSQDVNVTVTPTENATFAVLYPGSELGLTLTTPTGEEYNGADTTTALPSNVVYWNTAGSVGYTVTHPAAGTWTMHVTAIDVPKTGEPYTAVTSFTPTTGFVTGTGWVTSPAGAYPKNPTASGKATFDLVSKYEKGAKVPTGNVAFQVKAANMNFKSTSYEWLVILGAKAQFKGTGTINGAGAYTFVLTATDGNLLGGGKPDTFRIKIWNDSGTVYDNLLGAADDADPTTVLGGGSIVIHK